MKQIIVLLLLLFSYAAQSQSIKLQGKVLAKESNKELPYVNIGIRNKNIGTTSDESGNFILSLPEVRLQDTLTFSAIGYAELSVPITTLVKQHPLQVQLSEKHNVLHEVVVKGHKMKIKKLGVTGRLPVVWGAPENKSSKDIYEFANFIKLRGKYTELLSAHFYIASTKLDSALFRINLYKNSSELLGTRLVEKSIVKRLPAKAGWVSIDLQPYEIYTDEDFFLGIEYLPGTGVDQLAVLLGAKLGGSSYSREASLGTWEKFTGASLSGYVTVRQ